ncbi:hypothetical protein [Nonomuraea sediminis]|uniref:hypothetical protein n=1 Tax=Nonomuraea sediminis TaxID=2835864 RepID=UPI001BDDC696|nr:hypothetical protein [Nonomuraea sediminis]
MRAGGLARGRFGSALIRRAVLIPLVGAGVLAGWSVRVDPWALLVTAALIVGLAQQTLP